LQLGAPEVAVKFAAATVLAAALAFAPAIRAQSQTPSDPHTARPTFRSASSLVALNVTVTDSTAKYVSGLQPGDFVVYEDGVKQDVQFFESASVPLDLIVLIDTSSSMSDKVDVVHEAASGFLKTLRQGDRGAVVTFADGVNVLQALTDDRGLLEQAVRKTGAHGETALYNAVYISLKQFGQAAHGSNDVRRQAIVVLSDGEDTVSLVSLEDMMAVARRMGVNIYTVSLQSRNMSQQRAEQGGRRFLSRADDAMKAMARETGGQSFFPGATELKRVYSTIATELANQYSIGYVPANNRLDGRFRRVIVQIITRPELHPRTRPGYTAGGRSSPSAYDE
jgi:Ca-activated chloride channel family protein